MPKLYAIYSIDEESWWDLIRECWTHTLGPCCMFKHLEPDGIRVGAKQYMEEQKLVGNLRIHTFEISLTETNPIPNKETTMLPDKEDKHYSCTEEKPKLGYMIKIQDSYWDFGKEDWVDTPEGQTVVTSELVAYKSYYHIGKRFPETKLSIHTIEIVD